MMARLLSGGRRTARELGRDERGAVMVAATFMAIFLTAMLFYLMSVGDAILYRERVQDASDAVAFAGAVYHARGMNIIVTLNIVMAVLLGLLVAARLLLFLTILLNIISCACIPVPVIGQAVCAPLCTTVMPKVVKVVAKVVGGLTRLYNRVGPVLSKVQKGVSVGMPWVAEGKAIGVSFKYRPDVRFGFIASPSQVPIPLSQTMFEKPMGLPVEDGENSDLCDEVKESIVNLVLMPVREVLHERILGWVEEPMQSFVATFCGGGDDTEEEDPRQAAQRAEDDVVKERCEWESRVTAGLNHYHAASPPYSLQTATEILDGERSEHFAGNVDLTSHPCFWLHSDRGGALWGLDTREPLPPPYGDPASFAPQEPLGVCSFNQADCEERARAEFQQRMNETNEENQNDPELQVEEIDRDAKRKILPKVLLKNDNAHNSSILLQVWSATWADDARVRRLAEGVALAVHPRRGSAQSIGGGEEDPRQVADLRFLDRVGYAQAEFYYDSDGCWSEGVQKQAMWNLNWRARLRRIGPLSVPDFVTDFVEKLTAMAREDLESAMGDGTGSAALDSKIMDLFDEGAGRARDEAVRADEAIERRVREEWNRRIGIH